MKHFFLIFIILINCFNLSIAQQLDIFKTYEYPSFAKKVIENNDTHPEKWISHVFFNYVASNNFIEEEYKGYISFYSKKDNLLFLKLDGKLITLTPPKFYLSGIKFKHLDYFLTFNFSVRVNFDGPYDGQILISKNGITKRYYCVFD